MGLRLSTDMSLNIYDVMKPVIRSHVDTMRACGEKITYPQSLARVFGGAVLYVYKYKSSVLLSPVSEKTMLPMMNPMIATERGIFERFVTRGTMASYCLMSSAGTIVAQWDVIGAYTIIPAVYGS